MKFSRTVMRSVWSAAGMVAVGAAALVAAGSAQARDDVFWSVGVQSPGVSVGVANAPPVYMAPQPVYVAPQPVYVQPRPVYRPAPVYYAPQPVYVQPRPVYQAGWVEPGYGYGDGRGWHKHKRHHHRHDGWRD